MVDQINLNHLRNNIQNYSLPLISLLIRVDWEKMSPHAKPYFYAMQSLTKLSDHYGCDSGVSVASYFLSNAMGWRGEIAKIVKKELNRRIKELLKEK